MASYGRRGLSKLIISSVMQKVLSDSKIPVVVCRRTAADAPAQPNYACNPKESLWNTSVNRTTMAR
jgi:hypothetical protein